MYMSQPFSYYVIRNIMKVATSIDQRLILSDSSCGYYNLAKKCQCVFKDLSNAVYYYRKAIETGDRADSAIKDLASVLHKKGNTRQAINFLIKHRTKYCGDLEKYDNLIANLRRQLGTPSSRYQIRNILVLPAETASQNSIRALFGNPSRILQAKFFTDLSLCIECPQASSSQCCCLLLFDSHSAARKTAQSLKFWLYPQIELYWVNSNNLIIGRAQINREKETELNSFYQGFSAFGNSLMILDDDDLLDRDQFREIKDIWKTDRVQAISQRDQFRLRVENLAKLQLLRNRNQRVDLQF